MARGSDTGNDAHPTVSGAVSFFMPRCMGSTEYFEEKPMNNVPSSAPAGSVIADISLADWGRKEIKIAETEMPGLMAIR